LDKAAGSWRRPDPFKVLTLQRLANIGSGMLVKDVFINDGAGQMDAAPERPPSDDSGAG
jgi:hypothetical protein